MTFTDPSLQIQAAIVKALRDSGPLTAIVAKRIYDATPATASFPYVSIGPASIIPELAECTDAAEVTIQIDVWSRGKGFPQVKEIGREITLLLHDAELPLVGGGAVHSLLLESTRYQRDPDGLTSHGILTFNILTDANS